MPKTNTGWIAFKNAGDVGDGLDVAGEAIVPKIGRYTSKSRG